MLNLKNGRWLHVKELNKLVAGRNSRKFLLAVGRKTLKNLDGDYSVSGKRRVGKRKEKLPQSYFLDLKSKFILDKKKKTNLILFPGCLKKFLKMVHRSSDAAQLEYDFWTVPPNSSQRTELEKLVGHLLVKVQR